MWSPSPCGEAQNQRTVGLSLGELVAVGKERFLLTVSLLAALYQINTWVTVYGFTPNVAAQLGASKAQLGWLSLVSTLRQPSPRWGAAPF